MMRTILAAALILLAGCGGDSTGPTHASVNGTWRFSFTNMTGVLQGVAVSCSGASLDFTLTQSNRTFSGVQVGAGRMSCSAQGQEIVDTLVGGETIVEGNVNQQTVTFRLGTIPGTHQATVTGTSMTGTAQWILTSGNTSVTLNGQFSAARL